MQTQTMITMPIRWLQAVATLFVDNPVINRELKVRVRFARGFWLQGGYLIFLIMIISLAYQGILAKTPVTNPAQLQGRLQGFYFTMLYSLIGIITLITPALSAGAISFERERRTLDLLLVTPIRPSGILTGKLIASFAFVLLLLVLSMPIATVCIIFGGATLSDLLGTYAIIAFDALHLCALALYCSAVNNASGTATFWAYLSTGGLLVLSAPVVSMGVGSLMMAGRFGSGHAVTFPLASLHPFAAPLIKALPVQIFGLKFPCWLFCGVFSVLLTRLWLTGAAARVGMQGNATGSLRRQGLLLCLLGMLSGQALSGMAAPLLGMAGAKVASVHWGFVVGIFALSVAPVIFFLPFVSTTGHDADRPPAEDGWFNPRKMFQPVSSGALPFLLTWFLLNAATGLVVHFHAGLTSLPWTATGAALFYFLTAITFFWSVGRLWSAATPNLKVARHFTLASILLALVLPGGSDLSLFAPFKHATPDKVTADMMLYGAVLACGAVVLLCVAQWIIRERRGWISSSWGPGEDG